MELYGYEIQREKDLSHHGILGQKWGIRRYQNKDGTLTAAGKKRLAKNLSKQEYSSADEAKNYAKSKIEGITISNYEDLQRSYSLFIDAAKNHDDYYDDGHYLEDSKLAYDDTYKWFQKNDPEYLKKIIKENNGDKSSLDRFHDFRKTFEGYESERWTAGEKKYYSDPKNKAARDKEDAAYKAYMQEASKALDSLIGDFGSMPAKVNGNFYYSNVERILNSVIGDMLVKDYNK